MKPPLNLYPAPQKCTFHKGTLSLKEDPSSLEFPVLRTEGFADQEYRVQINQEGIKIHASTDAAAFHAGQTLKQIISQCGNELPCLEIHDWPDIATRGLMLDVSRCKVPTMETVYDMVDWMASIKLNQFQLYIEHTFAFPGHDIVWEEASPFTPEEIRDLDVYCSNRYIELVPNFNSFGHMERWLRHEPYKHLAECPDGFYSPNHREQFSHGTTLYPDAASLELVSSLYDTYLPNFSSKLFNVGGDEPWELGIGRSKDRVEREGKGRVYLEFMKGIQQLVHDREHTMLCWADILMENPEIIPEVPKNIIPVIWGYSAKHPFDEHCEKVALNSPHFYVAPGNNTWNSLTCRLDEALENMKNAALNGLKHGVEGYLITTWGDNGNHQPWITLFPGILQGACSSWALEKNNDPDIAAHFDHSVFKEAGLGDCLIRMGRCESILPLPFPNHPSGRSATHTYLFLDEENLKDRLEEEGSIPPESSLRQFLKEANQLENDILQTNTTGHNSIPADEMLLGLRMARLGARRAGALLHKWEDPSWPGDLEIIKNEYARVWLLRARQGGLKESLGYFPHEKPLRPKGPL